MFQQRFQKRVRLGKTAFFGQDDLRPLNERPRRFKVIAAVLDQPFGPLACDFQVELQPDWIVVTPKGRLLVRVVCMVFDQYLRAQQRRASYSKVI